MNPVLECNPFAPGESFDRMWPCCAGTHASPQWQTNGNDCYAAPGTKLVAPITGRVVRVGVPPVGQGVRVGIQGAAFAVYMAHMRNVCVTLDQPVRAGDPVGEIEDDLGFPPHLHFSIARGPYDSGTFVDPWTELARTATNVGGRTFHVGEGVTPLPDDRYWYEEIPWDPATDEGYGPRVLGPWALDETRDVHYGKLDAAGRIVTRVGAPRRFYVYDWRPKTYGEEYLWSFDSAAARDRDYRQRKAATGRTYRRFRGRSNSVYPLL